MYQFFMFGLPALSAIVAIPLTVAVADKSRAASIGFLVTLGAGIAWAAFWELLAGIRNGGPNWAIIIMILISIPFTLLVCVLSVIALFSIYRFAEAGWNRIRGVLWFLLAAALTEFVMGVVIYITHITR